ncbi:28S ribosomal protein S5, mitochondrial [Leptopilina boulardi]|uniref:28S ribosomal protein S5, mitochondrial n=1 Tax=Leptopilina boulardi TaxID=63433 RepID=UPI0021F50EE3|nr:28S ribosomal protein S5, mitochondrial [Leptopilina boulardi]
MAFRLLQFCGQISKTIKNVRNLELRQMNNVIKTTQLLSPQLPIKYQQRTTSFFTKKSGEELWKSVTSVSNAGRRRGRGKRGSISKLKKNLNWGQRIGIGKKRMLWPGLTGPVIQGKTLIQQQRLPDDPDFEKKIIDMREASSKFKKLKVHPLERGWTSAKLGGKKLGPPSAAREDESFEGFETIILEHKITGHMTGNMGRVRTFSCFVVTGNGNGLVGIALGKSTDNAAAVRNAKNSSGKKLFYVNRYMERTVFHDFFTRFGNCKIFVKQKPPGYGLICHRAIKAICEVIGIKDLHAKIEGTTNVQTLTKAFLIGLLRQKTHQNLADEKKLHLVEINKNFDYFPNVVASPSTIRSEKEISSTEIMDFRQFVMDGKVILQRKKYPPFYTRLKGWELHLKKMEKLRDQDNVRLQLIAEYGDIRSFLSEKYPEAVPQNWCKKKEVEQVEEEE